MSTNPGIQRPDPTNRTRTVAVRRPQDLTTTPPATTPRGRGVTKAATTDLTPTQGRRGVLDRLRRRDLARQLASAGLELCRQCDWRNVRYALYAVYGFSFPGEQQAAVSTGAATHPA